MLVLEVLCFYYFKYFWWDFRVYILQEKLSIDILKPCFSFAYSASSHCKFLKKCPSNNCPVPRMGSALKSFNIDGILELRMLEEPTGGQKYKYAKQKLWVVVGTVKGIILHRLH